MRLQFFMDAAKEGKLKAGPDVHAFQYCGDVRALLVEPVNEQPFVAVGAYSDAGDARFEQFTVHTFGERSPSGVDLLRARIAAQRFLDSLGV
jgi:hypothetical protein